MGDREAFLRAINAKPEDEAPKLVYCDWLEEREFFAEAMLIRAAIKHHYENISVLLGQTLTSIEVNTAKDEIEFTTVNGGVFRLYHDQDCCESVTINDVEGNFDDLLRHPILMAEEVSSETPPEGVEKPEYPDNQEEWTFYRLATVKGYVTIRWYGTSNGYYSTSVSFKRIREDDKRENLCDELSG